MTSLIAIPLLLLLIAWAVTFAVRRQAERGWRGDWFAGTNPALMALFAVLAAYLAGWLLALAANNL